MMRTLIAISGLLSVIITGCAVPGFVPPTAQEQLKKHIELSGEWFIANQDKDEFLRYEYLVNSNEFTNANNELRKMGAAWSIAELYRFTRDNRFRELAEQGVVHFRKFIVNDPADFAYLDVDGKRKLGYNGLFMMALLGLDPSPGRDDLLKNLAAGILHQQKEDGSYNTYFYSDRNTGQDFYPGEANLALIALFEDAGDQKYRDAVALSFPYYRDYWRDNHSWAFIPWHTQAFVKLYRADPRDEYRDFVFEMNDMLIEGQQTQKDHEDENEIGGFGDDPGISTSSYIEGINDAYALAKEVGDEQRIKKYGTVIQLATNFLMSLQYTEDQKFGLRSLPPHILGGVRQSLGSDRLRVDNNQHMAAALIKVYENGLVP